MNHGQQIDQRSERLSNDVAGLFAFRLEAIKRINAIEQRLDDLTAPVVESLVEPETPIAVGATPLATEAEFDGKPYRYSETRDVKKGDVYADCRNVISREIVPVYLVIADDIYTPDGPRRIFIPVEPASDVPLPEGCRRETRPVLIVPTRNRGPAEVLGVDADEADDADDESRQLFGTIDGFLYTWTCGGKVHGPSIDDGGDLTVSLTAEQWKALLGVNQP